MNGNIHKSGDTVGDRYLIDDYIGQGGMQEVYRARDTLLERYVALKTPKMSAAQKRFKRSAVVSARINHDSVAKTLDYIEANDRAYLAEELVIGCNLAEFRRDHVPVLDPYSVATVFHHLARGISASHHANVTHRDLKPSNIMVVGDSDFQGIKITDFGIAKLAEDELGAAVEGGGEALTASATALGALPYMSPEMIDDFKTASLPTDIWAAGAIAYELLTGVKPFGDGYKVVLRIATGKPPALPAQISNNVQFSALSNQIYALILRCFERDTQKRLTADQLAAECGNLCYSKAVRQYGTIASVDYGVRGFISSDSGQSIFYHSDSTYNMPSLEVGKRVWFSDFPGNPRPRAFPIVPAHAGTGPVED